MRKIVSTTTILLLTILFSATVSFAQTYAYKNVFPKADMLNFMSNDNEATTHAGTISISPYLKLQKSFDKQFKNAVDVKWYPVKKDYLAMFDYEGRDMTALFSKNGYNIYSIAYSTEKDLPKEYRRAIKSLYVDFDILSAVEINSAEVKFTTWLVYLKDDKNIVIARILDGSLDEFARFDNVPRETRKQRKGHVIIPKK